MRGREGGRQTDRQTDRQRRTRLANVRNGIHYLSCWRREGESGILECRERGNAQAAICLDDATDIRY